jgi:oxalate decarboxylase/phosphoglucose isomerase-like protein (cupin superfamily)
MPAEAGDVIDDLTALAGFRLCFDPTTLAIEADSGFSFIEHPRHVADLRAVLERPDAAADDLEVYRTYLPADVPPAASEPMARLQLTFSLVAVAPLRVGREFAKTHGHLHSLLPGTRMTTPEVYALLRGRLTLLLQRDDPGKPDALDDFVALELAPGDILTIPPNYAHALANRDATPGLLAGLYGTPEVFPAEYGAVERHGGFGYRLVADTNGRAHLQANPRYRDLPQPRILARPFGTLFTAPEPGAPLWTTFIRTPDVYAFLTEPAAALRRFGPSGRGDEG